MKAHIYDVKQLPFGDGIWVHVHLVCFPHANMTQYILLSYVGMVEDKETDEVIIAFSTLSALFNGTNLSYDRAELICSTVSTLCK